MSLRISPGNAPASISIPESGGTLTNAGPCTVYYGGTRYVSDVANNDGSIASGGSVTLFGSTFVFMPRVDGSGVLQAASDVLVQPLSLVGSSGIDPSRSPYGADKTGAIDATAAFQAAYADAVTAGHYTLSPSPGTYTVSGRIHGSAVTTNPVRVVAAIPSSVIIQRSTAQCIVEVQGARTASVALSADVAQGAQTFTLAALPTGGLSVDDHVELSSNVLFATGTGASAATVAEVAKVKAITGAGPYTVTLYGPLEEAYATANAGAVSRLDLAGADSYLSGVVFRQTAQSRDDAGFPLVRFNLCKRVKIDRCTGRDADVPGFEIRGCIDVDVVDVLVENLTDNLGSNWIGYGINLAGNSRDVRISRPRGKWVRHVVTTSYGATAAGLSDVGVPRHVTVSNGQGNGTNGGAWNTHKEGKYITFSDCESHNDKSFGYYIRSPHTTIVNPSVSIGGAGGTLAGIKVAETEATDCMIVGGKITLGPGSFSGVQTESPRTTCIGTWVVGPGGAGSNFRIEATGTESAFIGVRSKEPFAAGHFSYAAAAGPGHVIQGGVFNSASGKQLLSSGGGTTSVRVSGGPTGVNLTAIANSSAIVDTPTNLVAKSSSYTLSDIDRVATFDATAAVRTATLPSAVTAGVGREYAIKKIDVSVNAVTVATTSSQTIDGAATVTLAAQWDSVRVVSNGTNWLKI